MCGNAENLGRKPKLRSNIRFFFANMGFPSHLVSLFAVLLGLAAASPASASPRSRIAQPPTDLAQPSATVSYAIDPVQHPDWAGNFVLSDCEKARYYFRGRVAFYNPNKHLTFWSRRWTTEPEGVGETFELPFGYKYSESPLLQTGPENPSIDLSNRSAETCTILLRMAKDFGAKVLPVGDGFVNVTDWPNSGSFRWRDVLKALDGLFYDVVSTTGPDWAFGGEFDAGWQSVVMYIPSSSVISRRWAGDMRGTRRRPNVVLGGRNRTASTVE
ncbi:MAG: hypothetical protein Q9206_003375 [Seirophora lacunosa]